MISNFMLCLAHFSVNPLVATYAEYLNAAPELIGLIAGMFFGVALAMRPFTGIIVTKIDKKKILVFVFVLGIAAHLGYALFRAIPVFVVFRVLHGIQYGLIGLVLLALAGDHLPKNKMISGIGIFGIGGAVASAVAPSIGDGLVRLGTALRGEAFGFTLMFLFGAFIFCIALIPAFILVADNKTKEDVAGVGAWYKNILSVHTLPLALLLFMIYLPHAMIHTYMFDFGRAQGIVGISIFYLVLALTLTVTRPASGVLTDRLGPSKVVFPAFVIYMAALLVIGFSNSLWMLIVGAALTAIGAGSSQPTLQAMCVQTETPIKRGVASNTVYIGLDLGLFLGPILGGFVRNMSDFPTMFKTAAVPILISMVALAAIMPSYKRRVKALEDAG